MSGKRPVSVNLKGLNRNRKRLADGTIVEYYYAWKGGPRLPGKPGDQLFLEAYVKHTSAKVAAPRTSLVEILDAFQSSADFGNLAPRTQLDYRKGLFEIKKEFGTLPLKALSDPRTRGAILDWRDEKAKKSKRQADYLIQMMSKVFSWALDRGKITTHPLRHVGRLYKGERSEHVWSVDQETAFIAVAPPQLHIPFYAALWLGQREGDLLSLTWQQYDGTSIRLQQSKTKARICVPVAGPLKALLDAARQKSGKIMLNASGVPWTQDGFRSTWSKARDKSGAKGLTFNDLRGTAVTRLALAGSTVPEIVAITGHSLKDVSSILDKHYLNRDVRLAESGISKLEKKFHPKKSDAS